MSEDKEISKHIGEQKPINQNPEPANNNGNNTDNNSENPIKPQETQKGVDKKK